MKKLEKKIRKSITSDEKSNLENLKKYKILYNKSEPIFDQLAAFTATLLDTPIAVINFIDQHSVWGGAPKITSLGYLGETSLCSLAIKNESATSYENIAATPSLISNPLIAGELGMRFYATAPIITDEGFTVGSVTIVDKKQRKFLPNEQRKLEWVAALVRKEMNKRIAEKVCA